MRPRGADRTAGVSGSGSTGTNPGVGGSSSSAAAGGVSHHGPAPATPPQRARGAGLESAGGGGLSLSLLRDRLGHTVSEDDPKSLFQLEERLGKGSFGSVYRGVHKRTGEWVAIKIISLAEDEAVEDVRREIGILKECENSHIVKYFGSYFEEENLWVRPGSSSSVGSI